MKLYINDIRILTGTVIVKFQRESCESKGLLSINPFDFTLESIEK